mgnify:CR=1 FL=1
MSGTDPAPAAAALAKITWRREQLAPVEEKDDGYIERVNNLIDKIQQINRDINTQIKEDDITPNIQWIPQSFEFFRTIPSS